MTQEQRFSPGDRVFAKLRGFPPWPAMIRERLLARKTEIYKVYFYGGYDTANVRATQLYEYNEDNLAKFGNQPHRKLFCQFRQALEEIVENVVILDLPTDELITVEAETETVAGGVTGRKFTSPSPNPMTTSLQNHNEFAEKVIVKQIIRSPKSITTALRVVPEPAGCTLFSA